MLMFLFYWLARVPKKSDRVQDSSKLKSDETKVYSQEEKAWRSN